MAFLGDNMFLIAAGIFMFFLTIFFVYFKLAFTFWKTRGVPYILPIIPWGSFDPPHKRQMSYGDEIEKKYKYAKAKGWKHVGLFAMTDPVYIPIDLDLIKHIVTKDFNYFNERGMYINEKKEPIGAHLFALGGNRWRNLRNQLSPTFTSGKIKAMFQTLAECGLSLENYLLYDVNYEEPVNIKHVFVNYSTDVVGSCAFGINCKSFQRPENKFRQMSIRIFKRTGLDMLKFTLANNFPNLARFFGYCIFDKPTNEFFKKLVTDTVGHREKNNVVRNDFLQLLIAAKNNELTENEGRLTIDEIIAQTMVFFVAGFETSSSTMAFAMYELSLRQDIQEKIREEIKLVLKKYDGKITYEALLDMKYMGQCIDETLRKHPPVSFVTRLCNEDYDVPNFNFKIKKGIRVFIPIKGVHYDEEYYKNPDEFDPDRFSEENKRNRNPYAFLPFGEGPRICIGMRFGILQTKLALTTILKNFHVSLNSKTKTPLKTKGNVLVAQAQGGIWLNLKRIE